MAARVEIVEALERLEAHCRAPLMTIDQRSGWMRDWCEDLGDFNIADISAACQKWRNGDDRKFPLPGQFKAILRSLRKGEDKVQESGGEWKPVSEEEYQKLTLSDKIRHHKIMSQRAFTKAGPQWKAGRPVPKEEMPDIWFKWRQVAKDHAYEAQVLQGKMTSARIAAE